MNKKIIGHHIFGNGATKVIALHGWMDDAQTWETTIQFLNLNKYTYVFVDIRGYGTSKAIKGDYTLEEITNDTFNLANALGFTKFHLIGHSMCGMVAQYAALSDLEKRIEKVVLVTPVASSGFPADEETKDFLKSIVQNVEIAKMGYGAFSAKRYSAHWYTLRAERHVKVTDEAAQLGYMNVWLNENFKGEMSAVETPFLVVAGAYDHPLFRADAQKKNFEEHANVEIVICENSGHFPMQEAPVFLASTIENYFD